MKDSFIYEHTKTINASKGFGKYIRLLMSLLLFMAVGAGIGTVTGATIYETDFIANPTSPATQTSDKGSLITTAVGWAPDYDN